MSFLNKKIFNTHNTAFGLDISDLSVKVIELKQEGKTKKVSSFGICPMPPGVISGGDIVDPEKVSLAIRKAVESSGPHKIKNKKVVCAIPETKAFLRIINIPKMNEEEIGEAIKWEIEANIPLSIDQVYYDWKLLEGKLGSQDNNKLSILVLAVSQKTANSFLEAVEGAGLTVVGLEVESMAQARSLISDKSKDQTTFVIDLGQRTAGFIILSDNNPCFTSSIPLASQSLTEAISKMLSQTIEEAEKTKLKYGIGSFIKQDPVFLAVKPVLDNLVSEIEKSIDFYLTGLHFSEGIDKIMICGGGANTKGLIPYLSKKLEREVEIGDPWINFNQKNYIPIVERKVSAQYSTAIGLAIRGLNFYENIS